MSVVDDVRWWYAAHYDSSDPFGSYLDRDLSGPGHLGSDFNGMPAGTPVPSWCSGIVHSTGWDFYVGYWSVVQRSQGGFGLLYHQTPNSQTPAGTVLQIGSTVGLLGDTGDTSHGAHAHWGFSPSTPMAGTGNVIDPWPVIMADLSSNTSANKADLETKEMMIIRTTQAWGDVQATFTALVGFKSLHHLSAAERNALRDRTGMTQYEMSAAEFQAVLTALQIPLTAAQYGANYDGNN